MPLDLPPLPPPPTVIAKAIVHHEIDYLALDLGGRVIVRKDCPVKGHSSRVCFARITGPKPLRFRFTITARPNDMFLVSARVVS